MAERYCIVARPSQLISKLMRVNRESRDVALGFYRVHLSCEIRESRAPRKAGTTLYLNPEYDILQISQEILSEGDNVLCDFFYRLKTSYDPRHVGLSNMPVELSDLMYRGPYQPHASVLKPEVRNATIETLTELREVYFIRRDRDARQIPGRSHPRRRWSSCPIMPETVRSNLGLATRARSAKT